MAAKDKQIRSDAELDLVGTTVNVTGVLKMAASVKTVAADTSYTITDTDGFDTILVTTGASTDNTITLPTAADNTGRTIKIKKVNAATANNVVIDGEGAETIDGDTAITLFVQYDAITIYCDGTEWHILVDEIKPIIAAYYVSNSTANTALANNTREVIDYDVMQIDTHSAVTDGATWKFEPPRAGNFKVTANFQLVDNGNWNIGEQMQLVWSKDGGSSNWKLDQQWPPGDGAASVAPNITSSGVVDLLTTDDFCITVLQNSGTGLNVKTSERTCHIVIEEIK